jgi:hypothetical protein
VRHTGIPNIDVYMALSREQVKQQDLVERMKWLLRFRAIRELVTRQIPSRATAAERAASAAHIWGEVVDDEGNRAVGLIHGPEAGLVWTSRCSLDVVAHVLARFALFRRDCAGAIVLTRKGLFFRDQLHH